MYTIINGQNVSHIEYDADRKVAYFHMLNPEVITVVNVDWSKDDLATMRCDRFFIFEQPSNSVCLCDEVPK